MISHSPAPWHVDGPLDNEPTDSMWFDVMSPHGNVAHLQLDARPPDQHLNQMFADAILIAAAPALLEALKQALPILTWASKQSKGNCPKSTLTQVSAAIQKADLKNHKAFPKVLCQTGHDWIYITESRCDESEIIMRKCATCGFVEPPKGPQ